jgi:DNA-directed RNA polymerase specialized sigma24 family protein
MGLLPSCFVDSSMFYKLFRTPKEYMTHLVKDYEAFVEVANLLNETPEYSKDEADDLVQKLLRESFSGRRLNSLTNDEKGRLAVLLSQHYQMSADQIAEVLKLPPYLVNQFLHAKDYGKKKR